MELNVFLNAFLLETISQLFRKLYPSLLIFHDFKLIFKKDFFENLFVTRANDLKKNNHLYLNNNRNNIINKYIRKFKYNNNCVRYLFFPVFFFLLNI